jgi:serine/threonine protein kinase
MRCPSCQSENDDARDTCGSCGQPLAGTASPTLTVGTVVGSRYEILALLGKGGMGMVFKAKDRVLDEIVALKILRPDVAGSGEMARRFRNEIKLARKVRHKNVCGIHEYNEEGALQYIAMEYVEGIDLKCLLRERGGLPAPEAFDVALQLAQGLEAIHDVGIIHRDLKTANAMLDRHGIVRLMDFGIAKKFDAEASLGATAVGQVIGTPEYMSPEQARGEKIDFRSDIYALGVMVFELFTGHVPFRAETPIATIFKHLQEPPPLEGPAAAAIPPALVPVLACCLAKDPAARYPSAGAVVEALRTARLATCPEVASPVSAQTRGAVRTPLPPSVSLPGTPSPTPGTPRALTPQPGASPSEIAPTVATPMPRSYASVRAGVVARPAMPPTRLQASTPTLSSRAEPRAHRNTAPLYVLGGIAFVGVAGIAVLLGLWLRPAAREQSQARNAPGDTPAVLGVPVTPEPSATLTTSAQVAPSQPGLVPSPRAAAPAPTPAVTSTISASRLTMHAAPIAPTPRAVAMPTPAPATVASSEDVALLDVTARPMVDVTIDGEPRGHTPLKGLRLRPGPHAIMLSSQDYQPFRRKLTLGAGQRRSLDVDLTWDGVRK